MHLYFNHPSRDDSTTYEAHSLNGHEYVNHPARDDSASHEIHPDDDPSQTNTQAGNHIASNFDHEVERDDQAIGGASESEFSSDADSGEMAATEQPNEPVQIQPGVRAPSPVGMQSTFGDKPYYVLKGMGDQFFLFAGFVILLIGSWRYVAGLFAYQVGAYVFSVTFFFIGLTGHLWAMRVMDFLIEYANPAVALLWILVVYIGEKPKTDLRIGKVTHEPR
ncbi:MAG: hypothetical protein LAT57_14195 [Balneolales bacterium]|nr:hypothetical protein [Balneolales bacterium]